MDVDTRTDIYSLGVLLYEILTGRTPIDPKRLSTWVDANEQVIRGRSGRFDVSRSGGVKVLTTYLDSSADVGGTFIYHLAEDELRIVSGLLANQPCLPEIELRVFRRVKVAR